jgi:hypothetical protein
MSVLVSMPAKLNMGALALRPAYFSRPNLPRKSAYHRRLVLQHATAKDL